ncbi:hypothetical protein E8E12_010063 [Didymella heteroderae]|uniref:Glutathione transferase n=1 Tax=Didymella heteroderae TaxID=1769908 RepID=A0A9P4WVL5_9PLEO|nr:hypothetical protein E8E12_010063 [Didymella heteroderae]
MQQPSDQLHRQATVQPRSLTQLQQGPDGTFYDAQGLPLHPDLQQSLHANELFHQQQQQQYAQLSAPPQQPSLPQQFAPLPPHALHYEQQFAPQQQYAPQSYQQIQQVHHPQHHAHVTSPPFGLTPGPAHQIHTPHAHTPIHTTPRIAQRPLQTAQQTPIQQSPQQQQYSSPLESVAGPSDETTLANHGQFKGLKLIPNPPNLEEWRQRLFDVDEIITLTEEQFQTYFPHIDNVYSHRSTQRHKRKSFVSHYWDCRLKGRPPGTKKSTDPDKKKRKRVARERDLCDVKIKITEFFGQKEYEEQMGHPPPTTEEDDPLSMGSTQAGPSTATPHQSMFFDQQMTPQQTMTPWGIQPNIVQPGMNMFAPPPPPLPGPPSKKFYTFQRVNGNGGNGKGDGVAGPHKHTLEESDRVKKNIVIRTLAKNEKDVKKVQGGDSSKKTYHKKATGNALTTVKSHAKEEDLKLYGSCFCPFVQRVWISLEHKKISYQYIEVDPYKKPQSLLDVNPRGLVPAIRHGPSWSTHESTVIMEYFEDLNAGEHLLPADPQTRATSRLWSDHVNRHVIPMFYKLLQAQDQKDQITHAQELRDQINKLVSAADKTGPFFLGSQISFVDVQFAPWVLRLRRVLGPYRGWPEPEEGSRWKAWVDAIDNEPSVRATTSTDELYLDSYERYAENRPGTSQLADAVNSGRGLP